MINTLHRRWTDWFPALISGKNTWKFKITLASSIGQFLSKFGKLLVCHLVLLNNVFWVKKNFFYTLMKIHLSLKLNFIRVAMTGLLLKLGSKVLGGKRSSYRRGKGMRASKGGEAMTDWWRERWGYEKKRWEGNRWGTRRLKRLGAKEKKSWGVERTEKVKRK